MVWTSRFLFASLALALTSGCFPEAPFGLCDSDADCDVPQTRCAPNFFCVQVPLPPRPDDGGIHLDDLPDDAIIIGSNVDGGCYLEASEYGGDDLDADGGPPRFGWACPDLVLASPAPPFVPQVQVGRDGGQFPSASALPDDPADAGVWDGRGEYFDAGDAGEDEEPPPSGVDENGRGCAPPDGGLLTLLDDGGPGVPRYDGGYECPEP